MSTVATPSKLTEVAYERLKDMAVGYQFRPGERLAEVEIARRLNMSRTPVREALHRLAMEGFLSFSPKGGFRARLLDAKEVFDLYEVRRSLEITAVRLAIARASAAERTALSAFVAQSRSAPADASVVELVVLDEKFHETIARLSGNRELLRILQNINERIRFCRWIDMERRRRAETQREHAAIAEAIERSDEDRAVAVMGAHINRRTDQIVAVIREGYARIYMADVGLPTAARPEGAG